MHMFIKLTQSPIALALDLVGSMTASSFWKPVQTCEKLPEYMATPHDETPKFTFTRTQSLNILGVNANMFYRLRGILV
jgi:hypothetical protein